MGRKAIVHFELELPSAAFDFVSTSSGRLSTNVPTGLPGRSMHVCVPSSADIRYVGSVEDGVYVDRDNDIWKRIDGTWWFLGDDGADGESRFEVTDHSDDAIAGFQMRRIDEIGNASE